MFLKRITYISVLKRRIAYEIESIISVSAWLSSNTTIQIGKAFTSNGISHVLKLHLAALDINAILQRVRIVQRDVR